MLLLLLLQKAHASNCLASLHCCWGRPDLHEEHAAAASAAAAAVVPGIPSALLIIPDSSCTWSTLLPLLSCRAGVLQGLCQLAVLLLLSLRIAI
jgi:hypothetical protein